MANLHEIKTEQLTSIKGGLNQLSETLLSLSTLVGTNDSTLKIDPKGRLTVDKDTLIDGAIGIGVSTISQDVDIETKNAVKFQGKKFEVGNSIPSIGLYHQGDIVWNDAPASGSNVGWICVRTGTPGEWKTFGHIDN